MTDAATVLWKELREIVGDRQSFRGILVQAIGVIITTGILVPGLGGGAWTASATGMLYLFFPALVAASIAADAFAGERERRTIETLFATPLTDLSIFTGKVAAAVIVAFAVSIVSFVTAIVTATVAHGIDSSAVPWSPSLVAGILGGALGSSLAAAALAVALSARIPVARAVQQMVPLVALAIVGIVALGLGRAGVEITWPVLLRVEAGLFVFGCAALVVSSAVFRRDRFFESRQTRRRSRTR